MANMWFSVKLLQPGDQLQWKNSYNQWQDAEFIGPTSDLDATDFNGTYWIKGMKNNSYACRPERMRAFVDAYGQRRQRQY